MSFAQQSGVSELLLSVSYLVKYECQWVQYHLSSATQFTPKRVSAVMVSNAPSRILARKKGESPILPVDLQQYFLKPELQLSPVTVVLDAGLLDVGLLDVGLLDVGLLDVGLLDAGVMAAVTLPAKAMAVRNETRDL